MQDAIGMGGNCPWRPLGWDQHCCREGMKKESSSEGGEKEPMSVSRAWPKSSDAWSQRDEWEGLYISTCGCLNISAWDCLSRCCECLYVSMCENLNIWIWKCILVSICEYLNVEHLDTSTCECLNISTCERLNILTCGCQPVNVSVVVMHSCLNISRCKCHNRPTCDVSTCELVYVSTSQHENVLPSQYMIAKLTAHECHGTMAPKSWVSHYFFSKQSPSEH